MTNQRSVFCRRLGLGLLCVGLGLGSSPALAQVRLSAAPAATPSATPNIETPAPDLELETYTDSDRFSIQLPPGWQVSSAEAGPLVITNFPQTETERAAQAEDLRTEVTLIEQPPGEVVPPALQEIQSQGYSLADYGAITIDGATALQLWLIDLPEAPESALMTYIGYDTATAIIVSRFDTLTPEIERLLTTLHSSFTRL
ncbi:MAG: hypothetical protein ICV77_03455 [Cyanobacteria bacterium Co-bin8]|nr:hypothetical protein [Cyanobacteria bacterium Co-bin8]